VLRRHHGGGGGPGPGRGGGVACACEDAPQSGTLTAPPQPPRPASHAAAQCHRCSAEIKDSAKAVHCTTCNARYAARWRLPPRRLTLAQLPLARLRQAAGDRGSGSVARGGLPQGASEGQCCPKSRSLTFPQCDHQCYCVDGPVACHCGRTKRKRQEKAAEKAEAGEAEAEEGVEAKPNPKPKSRSSGKRNQQGTPKALAQAAAQAGARAAQPLAGASLLSGRGTVPQIQSAATRALLACAPAQLGPDHPSVVTAANAAAAAFAVVLMSCYNQPAAAAPEAAAELWEEGIEARAEGEEADAAPDLEGAEIYEAPGAEHGGEDE